MALAQLAFTYTTVKSYHVEENHSLIVVAAYTSVSMLARDTSAPVYEADFLRRIPR